MPMIRDSWVVKNTRRTWLFALGLLFFSSVCKTEVLPLNFVVVKDQGVYRHIIDVTERSLLQQGVNFSTRVIETSNNPPASVTGRVITIGTQAAAFAYPYYANGPTTSALLTQSGFEQLIASSDVNSGKNTDKNLLQTITPLLLDQPLTRFFAIGSLLVTDAKHVGILVGPANEQRLPDIRRQAREAGLRLNVVLLKPDDNPIQLIEPVIKNSDFFVVLPDRKLINQLAAKWVLPLSYRYRVPVIAYSQKYVEAGALAAVFSSPDDVAETIADSVLAQVRNHPAGDQRFSISLNQSVARSLGIKLRPTELYRQQLTTAEVSPP